MRLGAALLVGLAGLIAGCGSGSSSSASGDVPFVLDPVEPVEGTAVPPAPPDVPACVAADLEATVVSSVPGFPAPEPGVQLVGLTARPGARCALEEWPRVQHLTDAGVEAPAHPGAGRPDRLLLAGRQRALAFLHSDGCTFAGTVTGIRLDLEPGQSIEVGLVQPLACEVSSAWTHFRQIPPIGWMDLAMDPARTPQDDLEVRLVDAVPMEQGDRVGFVVALVNPTAAPIPLDPCPVLSAGVQDVSGDDERGASITTRLNCAGAPEVVPPRGRIRFAVDLPLRDPPGAGSSAVLWARLHDDDREGHQPVQVTLGPA